MMSVVDAHGCGKMAATMDKWLRDRLTDGNVHGLYWMNRRQKQFRLPMKHLNRRDFSKADNAVYEVGLYNISLAQLARIPKYTR